MFDGFDLGVFAFVRESDPRPQEVLIGIVGLRVFPVLPIRSEIGGFNSLVTVWVRIIDCCGCIFLNCAHTSQMCVLQLACVHSPRAQIFLFLTTLVSIFVSHEWVLYDWPFLFCCRKNSMRLQGQTLYGCHTSYWNRFGWIKSQKSVNARFQTVRQMWFLRCEPCGYDLAKTSRQAS